MPKRNLYQSVKPKQRYEFYLAHEVLKDPGFFRREVRGTPSYKILDNGLNENGYASSLEQLNEAAGIIGANEFIYPDSLDVKESKELLEKCMRCYEQYPNLVGTRRMAVVKGETYGELKRYFVYLSGQARVDVIGFSKVAPNRVQLVREYGVPMRKQIHFLGFKGFSEFDGYEDVTKLVRSMDSRMMLEEDNLWEPRENLYSQVSLGGDRFISDAEGKVRRVRREYEAYGFC